MAYRDGQPRCGRYTKYGTLCTVATAGGPCHWHRTGSPLRPIPPVDLDLMRWELDPTYPLEPTPS